MKSRKKSQESEHTHSHCSPVLDQLHACDMYAVVVRISDLDIHWLSVRVIFLDFTDGNCRSMSGFFIDHNLMDSKDARE